MVTSVDNITVGPRRSVHLWEFLLELLMDESCATMIQWTDEMNGEFKLKSSEDVARKWGERKHKDGMNYDKLSRALRYYYSKDIIKKVSGRRFVYKFVPSPEMHAAVNAIKNHMVRLGIKRIPTGPFPHFQLNGEENNNLDQRKQEKLLSPAFHNMRPRSHSPNLDYGRPSLSRPSPPLSLSPPTYFKHEKHVPENHIVLGHSYENRDLTGKINDCHRSFHNPRRHFDRFRSRLVSERELSTRDREILNETFPLENRRSRIASTGDVCSSSQEDRMRELKRFVFENSRQLKENGIHLPSRTNSHTFCNPSPLITNRDSPKPKELYQEEKPKPKPFPRDRFYSENYISLDSTVLSDDILKERMRVREKYFEQRKCCSDCPSSRRDSTSVERHLSPSFRDASSRAPSQFTSSRQSDIRPYENGFSDSSHHDYRRSSFSFHKRSFSFDSEDIKPHSSRHYTTSHEIKHRPYEFVNSTDQKHRHRISPNDNLNEAANMKMKQEDNEHLDVASISDNRSNESDNEVFVTNNSLLPHNGHVEQSSIASSPPPHVYYYKRYNPMFDASTQTDEIEQSQQNNSEKTETKPEFPNNIQRMRHELNEAEKRSPIQTCVITCTESHKVQYSTTNITHTGNGYKSESHSSRNSTPNSFDSSPKSKSKKPCHCGCNDTNDGMNNRHENTVVVYPEEMV